MLDPAEAADDGSLHLRLDGVRFIPGDPPPALCLRLPAAVPPRRCGVRLVGGVHGFLREEGGGEEMIMWGG